MDDLEAINKSVADRETEIRKMPGSWVVYIANFQPGDGRERLRFFPTVGLKTYHLWLYRLLAVSGLLALLIFFSHFAPGISITVVIVLLAALFIWRSL